LNRKDSRVFLDLQRARVNETCGSLFWGIISSKYNYLSHGEEYQLNQNDCYSAMW